MGPSESWHRIGTGSLRFAYQHNHFDPDLCGADCLSLLFMSLIHAALARRLSRNLTPCPLAVAINVWAGRHVNQTSREEYGIATFGRINGRRFASPHVEDCELNASPAMKLLIAVALATPLLIPPASSWPMEDGSRHCKRIANARKLAGAQWHLMVADCSKNRGTTIRLVRHDALTWRLSSSHDAS